ncbi:MAG: hypothetical protein R6U57_09845 [Anaerolineales bacterium]
MSDHPHSKGKTVPEGGMEEPLEVIIQTDVQRVHGKLHIRPPQRLEDDLSDVPQFLTVTDGRVLSDGKESSLSFDVLMVNRDHVVWILPLKDREVGG